MYVGIGNVRFADRNQGSAKGVCQISKMLTSRWFSPNAIFCVHPTLSEPRKRRRAYTDKQMERMDVFLGKKRQQPEPPPLQLLLF
jgi:hypothetical protein